MFDDVKSTFEVPRVERPSRREFEERFLFPQRPVIISGAMEGWPARERWTNDYLKEKVGDAQKGFCARGRTDLEIRIHTGGKELFVVRGCQVKVESLADDVEKLAFVIVDVGLELHRTGVVPV